MLNALSALPDYSEELGLDVKRKGDRFLWFLASLLFAKRISAEIAKRTFREFIREGLTSPEKIAEAGWSRIVEVLDRGGYVRYDFSTADNILACVRLLVERYGGDIDRVHEEASGPEDLERRLREFRGIGPTAVNIFLRELRGVWPKAKPNRSKLALEVARRIGVEDVEKYESKLVRLALEYCKKRKCGACPVRKWCGEAGKPPRGSGG